MTASGGGENGEGSHGTKHGEHDGVAHVRSAAARERPKRPPATYGVMVPARREHVLTSPKPVVRSSVGKAWRGMAGGRWTRTDRTVWRATKAVGHLCCEHVERGVAPQGEGPCDSPEECLSDPTEFTRAQEQQATAAAAEGQEESGLAPKSADDHGGDEEARHL